MATSTVIDGPERGVVVGASAAGAAAASGTAPRCPEELLEESWAARGRPLGRREWVVEGAAALLFALAVAGLVAVAPGEIRLDGAVVLVVVAYAVATRVNFPIGLAGTAPSQLFLVPLFWLASPQIVPLLVALGLGLATLIGVAAGNRRSDRLICVGGDALHSLGPACVFVAVGGVGAAEAAPWLLGLALASQLSLDLLFGMVREHLISGVAPRLQTIVQMQIWAGDLALAPVGFLAAKAAQDHGAAPLALLPLVALLAYTTNDRRRRIAKAHERLETLKGERERLRLAVRRIGDALAANLDVDGILEIVSAAVTDAVHSDARRLVHGDAEVIDGGMTADVAQVLGLAADEALTAGGVRGVHLGGDLHGLACPLHSLGAVLAVARRGEAYDEDEQALMAYLCLQADVASHNVLHHEVVQHQALTDELTGLANHRHFQAVLDAGLREHADTRDELAVLLIDLDNFKRVNDEHGHLTGDEVLRGVGRSLRESCRASDQPARYGGEEFAVALTGLHPGQIVHFAERVRIAISEVTVRTPSGERLPVTASIGVAWMAREHLLRDDLMAAADAALYDAKRLGKNRVAWVDLDRSGEPAGRAQVEAAPEPAPRRALRTSLTAAHRRV